MDMKNKWCKKLIALVLAMVLVTSSLGFVSSGSLFVYGNDPSAVVAEERVEAESFADFVNTFSGLEGNLLLGFSDDSYMNSNLSVQLDALYTLFEQGIRNADGWIDDTTIDLTPYGEYWVKLCLITGSEYHYAFINGEMVEIEIGFVPNDMETRALRQALLAPHTVFHDIPDAYIPIDPFIGGFTVTNRGQHPFRSIGRLRTFWPNRTQPATGTAFLSSPTTAITAAHNLFNPVQGGHARALEFEVHGHAAWAVEAAWIDARWIQTQNFEFDQALLRVPPFAGVGNFLSVAPRTNASLTNITAIAVGFPWTLPENTLRQTVGRTHLIGPNLLFLTTQVAQGMSGGPLFDGSNNVIGIVVGMHYVPSAPNEPERQQGDGRAVRISQTLVDMIRIWA